MKALMESRLSRSVTASVAVPPDRTEEARLAVDYGLYRIVGTNCCAFLVGEVFVSVAHCLAAGDFRVPGPNGAVEVTWRLFGTGKDSEPDLALGKQINGALFFDREISIFSFPKDLRVFLGKKPFDATSKDCAAKSKKGGDLTSKKYVQTSDSGGPVLKKGSGKAVGVLEGWCPGDTGHALITHFSSKKVIKWMGQWQDDHVAIPGFPRNAITRLWSLLTATQ